MKLRTLVTPSLLIMLFLLTLFSCEKRDMRPLDGVYMLDSTELQTAYRLAAQMIKAGDVVTQINFRARESCGVNKYAQEMVVYLYKAGADPLQALVVPLRRGAEAPYFSPVAPGEAPIMKPSEGISYATIDLCSIASHLQGAEKLLPGRSEEAGVPLYFSGVDHYQIHLSKSRGQEIHRFTLESIDKSRSTNEIERYYELRFEAVNGKVVALD